MHPLNSIACIEIEKRKEMRQMGMSKQRACQSLATSECPDCVGKGAVLLAIQFFLALLLVTKLLSWQSRQQVICFVVSMCPIVRFACPAAGAQAPRE